MKFLPEFSEQDRYISVFILLLVIAHFLVLLLYFTPAISTPDANGYFAQARHISTTFSTGFNRESPAQYINIHWHDNEDGRYYSKYPTGLPLLIALPYTLFGARASLLLNPILASLTIGLFFLLVRKWLGGWWGLLAAALLAMNPTTNQHALAGDSHTAVLFFLVSALYCMSRWQDDMSKQWGFMAGFSLGMIPTIRYPEVLLFLPFLFYVSATVTHNRKGMMSLAVWSAGVALPLGALMMRNQRAFGAFWRTGYHLMEADIGFGWQYFLQHSTGYLAQLQGDGLGMVFGLGVTGITALCVRKETRTKGIFIALMVIPLTILYMSYFWPVDRASMRFLMPTFPAYIIGTAWLLKMFSEKYRNSAVAGALVLLAITASWGIPGSLQNLEQSKASNESLVLITENLSSHVASGSIIVADQMIDQHLDFIGKWRLADIDMISSQNRRPGMRMGGMGIPTGGSADFGNAPPDQPIFAGIATRPEPMTFEEFTEAVKSWGGAEHTVYWLVDQDLLDEYANELPFWEEFSVIETFDLPPLKLLGHNNAGFMPGRNRQSRNNTIEPPFKSHRETRTFVLARWER